MSTSDATAPKIVSDPDRVAPAQWREWLVTNGLGGFAAGTVRGFATRRYHGLLIAARPGPHGRWMMLNHVVETLRWPGGRTARLDAELRPGRSKSDAGDRPEPTFDLDHGLPVWTYDFGDAVLVRRVLMVNGRDTTLIRYRLTAGGPLSLSMRLLVHFRQHHDPVGKFGDEPSYDLSTRSGGYEIRGGGAQQPLRLRLVGAHPEFRPEARTVQEVLYREEAERGYHDTGELWSPGSIDVELPAGADVTLIASTEDWDHIKAVRPEEACRAERQRREQVLAHADPALRAGPVAQLVLAGDQFLVAPPGDGADRGGLIHPQSIVAGYDWFNEWGRDTMVSLEGLTLLTGRSADALRIIRRYADFLRDGLIPALIPEEDQKGQYHAADASLWFIHAAHRYVEHTGDRDTLRDLLPCFEDIIRHYLSGTRFNIRVDPTDGLVTQGVPDLPLTWMDAKVGDWVVTPRRGKAVEINALWYNALKLVEGWQRADGRTSDADKLADHAARARESFHRRFWYAEGGYLFDVVDGDQGDDPSCRPNQVFAIALPHPILDEARWRPVLDVVERRLLTPVGLRSLAPGEPGYQPTYFGDRRSRDAAYHEGTVWPWLIGPYIDAWLKLHPGERTAARSLLDGLIGALADCCIGTLTEIFDAQVPHRPRGCVAQAWSVAEVLRGWVKTAG